MAKLTLPRWLHSLISNKPKTIHKLKARQRLSMEELEGRVTPANLSWDGGGASNLWGDALNWNTNQVPQNGDSLLFPSGAPKLSNVNNLDGLTLDSIAIAGNGYTLSGNPVVLGSSTGDTGKLNLNGSGISGIISFDITLGGAAGNKQFFTVNSGSSELTITSKLLGTTGVELSKDGKGTLVLTADNSGFTGPISVTEGPLNIRHAQALGDTSSPTTVLYNTLTGQFGQLQVENVAGNIAEQLFLNGTGPINDGALLNVAGNNTWTGLVTLDSDTTVGANAASLTIQGVITDLGFGHSLTKEGPAKIILDPINAPGTPADQIGNSYRGRTLVNDGTLTIRHSLALGNESTPIAAVNDTVVNSAPNRSGTLQIEHVPNPNRIDANVNASDDGFTIPSELLVLNGPGIEGIHILPKEHLQVGDGTVTGALNNLAGNNTWQQDISLWSADSAMVFNARVWDWPTVGIGAEAGAQLTITGHVKDDLISGTADESNVTYSLIKVRPGRVVFVTDNTYRGITEVLEGYLNIRDSVALGTNGNATNGTIVFPGGSVELEADAITDSNPAAPAPDGTQHLDTDIVISGAGEQLAIMAGGPDGDGALRNIRGTNEITGTIPLLTFLGRGTTEIPPASPRPVVPRTLIPVRYFAVTFDGTGASVGVEPDQAPFGQFDLSQLTLSGEVSGQNLTKAGKGELVLADTGNSYIGTTFINEGWITIRNSRSLGADVFGPDTTQPPTMIAEGAALHIKRARDGLDIDSPERIFVSGIGIDHRYPELHRRGAILNLSGNNALSGVINLVATGNFPRIGIGADIANSPWVPDDVTVTESNLSFYNLMQQSPAGAAAGIEKLGRKRVELQGHGTFTGDNGVTEGVLRVQSDTALGMLTGTTTVASGAALEMAGYALDTGATLGPTPLNQWAGSVIDFSSEWPFGGWTASEATGAPDTFTYGDFPTAWSANNPSGPPSPEYLTMGYTTPVFATGVTVVETLSNGFVFQIDVLDVDDALHTVWTGVDPSLPGAPAYFSVDFAQTPYLVKGVKVYVNENHDSYWEEIDAVQLRGIKPPGATTDNTINGGVGGGIQLRESFVLNGAGNMTADDPTHNFTTPTLVHTLTNIDEDNMIRGPITLGSDVGINTEADSRLSLWKPIGGAGGITKEGQGKLILGGVNSYAGDTLVNAGTLNLQSSSALGKGSASEIQTVTVTGAAGTFTLTFDGQTTASLAVNATAAQVETALNGLSSIGGVAGSVTVTLNAGVYTVIFGGDLAKTNVPQMTAVGADGATVTIATTTQGGGGTTVANDAQIELQGDITIGGESLTLQGNGPNGAAAFPLRWFATGPGPIQEPVWSGDATTGRVTGVAIDPIDPNVIYLSAAGGGAWRSKNSGLTWQPLIDNIDGTAVDPTKVMFTGGIAVSPADSNTIYVALGESNNSLDSYYGRGVLKSSDYGKTWTRIQPGSQFERHSISKIVADPVEPNTVYVAVQGNAINEADGVLFGSDPGAYGIWRFRNGAWVNLVAGVTNPIAFSDTTHNYTDLQVFNANPRITSNTGNHPNQPNRRIIVFALGEYTGYSAPPNNAANAVYTSVDANTNNNAPTWTLNSFPVGTETVAGIPGEPRNGMIKLGGVRNQNSRDTITLYASITYPFNFPRLVQSQAGRFREIQTATVTYDPNTNLWTANAWASLGAQPAADIHGFAPAGQGWFDSVITVHSQTVSTPIGPATLGNPNFVFVGGTGFYTPSSGPFIYNGSAWNSADPGVDGKGPHVDYHAGMFDRTGRLLVGNDGGVWRLENTTPPAAGLADWNNLNGNFLQITQFNGVDVHPFDPFFAIGGSQDNSTHVYNDSLTHVAVEPGDGGIVRINNKDPQIAFHVLNGLLRKSVDGGNTWNTVFTTANSGLYFPFILDRVNPSRLILGDGADLWESMSDGTPGTFNVIGSATSAPSPLGTITQIAVADRQGPWASDPDFPIIVDKGADSYDSDTIYVTVNDGFRDGVYVTKNHGSNWVQRNNGLGFDTDNLADIAVDPRNRDVAYVVRNVFGGGHVYMSANAGQTWTNISGNLGDIPTWKVTVNPRNGDVYVGTDVGVYYLPGGVGTSWQRFGTGLPAVQIKELVFNSYTNMLSAGTYGRGLYQVWLDDSIANGGALRAVTGSSLWTGDVTITGALDLRAEAGAQLQISGVIADASGGPFTLNKVGEGKIIFSGANTYAGLTDIKEGALNVRNSSALGSTTAKTTVQIGAALEMQADLFGETVELNGHGIQINGHNTGALRNISNANTFTGALTLITDSTIGVDSGSQLTIGTKVGNPGAGTGVIDGPGTQGITKELSGTLVLNAANLYDGLTDVVGGVLRVEHATALGGASNGTQVRNGAQIQINRDTAGAAITVAAETLTLSGTGIFGTGALQNLNGNNTWQGNVNLTGIQGIAAPPPPVPTSTINIGVVNAADTLTIDGTITETDVTIPAQPPLIPAPVPLTSFGLSKVLPGKLVLTGSADNTYTGLTTVQTGVLNIQKAQALGNHPGSLSPGLGTVVSAGASLELQGGITYVAEPLTLNGRGVASANLGALRNFANNNTWTGPVILNSTVAAIAEVQRVIVSGASGTFTLTFNGQTTNAMPFNETAANVQAQLNALSSVSGVGGSVTVTLSSNIYRVTFGGSFAGTDQPQMTGAGTGGASVAITTLTNGSGAANPLIHIGADGGSQLTITGEVQDVTGVPDSLKAAELHKVGAGDLIFPNANTYRGRTFIDTGALNIRHAGALGTSGSATNDTTVVNGGTLQVQGGITVVSEVLTINGQGGGGQGALVNNGDANNWDGTVVLGSHASVGANTTAAGHKLTINGQLTDGAGTFNMTKVGPGTVEYASTTPNDYQGLTQVNEGILLLNKSGGALPFGGNLTIGDTVGAADNAILRIATNDQVPDTVLTTINSDGMLHTNGFTETINTVVINDGHVQTGAAPGALTIGTTLTMTGGDLELNGTGDQFFFAAGAAFNATSSATETAVIRGTGSFALAGAATRTFNVANGPLASDLQVTANISGTAAERLIKDGAGLMEIDSTTTYNGVTEAKAGILQVDGTIGAVELNGGTLGGIGFTGTVTSLAGGGTVNPGDSPGILHTGNTVWNPATTFFVELNRINDSPGPIVPGVDYDQLQVTGTINLNGANLAGVLNSLPGSKGVVLGDTFTILTTTVPGGITGTFMQNGVSVPDLGGVFVGGAKFQIDYTSTSVILTKVKADVTVDVTSTVNPTVWGQDVDFNVTVTPEAGAGAIPASATVTITLTGPFGNPSISPQTFGPVSKTLVNGQFSFDPGVEGTSLFGTSLEVGTYNVVANFQDPTNSFNDIDDTPTATDTHVQMINKANSTISLESDSAPSSVYGAPVTITAKLGIVPPGGYENGSTIMSGTVVFTLDSVAQPAETVFFNGTQYVAQFDLPTTLSVSDHTISAVYSGDGHFQGVPTTTDLVQKVIKANSAVSVVGAPSPSNVNQPVTFTVQVSAVNPSTGIPTGTVVIKDNGVAFNSGAVDANGQRQFQISSLTIGAHTITVDYQGDSNFNVSSGSTTHDVRGTSATTVVSSVNPSRHGQSVNFTATVVAQAPATGTATGDVEFVFTGATTFTVTMALTNGSAILTSNSVNNVLNAGANNLTVNYLGSPTLSPSSGSLPTQNVNAANTSTSLSSSPAGSTVYGQQVTLTATVVAVAPGAGVPVGTVDFFDGVGNQIGFDVAVNASGVATFNTTTLSATTHGNLFAVFTDNNDALVNFNPSTSNSISRTVIKANTSTALASSVSPNSVYGQTQITATVTPTGLGSGIPDGTVTFFISNAFGSSQVTNTLNSSGVATLDPPLNASSSTYQIFAVYNGSPNFNPSANSNTISQTVSQANTTTTLATSDNNAVYGEAIITATVQAVSPGAGVPSGGQVIFHVDNGSTVTDYAVTIAANGVARLNDVKVLDVGNYTITADYNGNSNFNGSFAAAIGQIVTPASSSVAVGSNINPSVYGQVVTFTATVSPANPAITVVPPGTVDFVIDGVTVATVPLNNGVATFQTGALTVSGSPHDVDVNYSGSNNFVPSNGTLSDGQTVNQGSTLSQVSSSANPQTVGQSVTFTATITAVSPALGTPTGTVDFIIDGSSPVGASNVGLDANGQATFTIGTLTQGNHTVVVHYDGDPNFTVSNSAVLNQEMKANTATTVTSSPDPSVFGQQVTVTATVVAVAPGVGVPTGSVTFIDLSNNNANLGTQNLNGAGQATLFISSLSVGEHLIRATYNGEDPGFFGSNGTLFNAQTVNKAGTTTSVAQDNVTTVFGQQVIFTATITVQNPGAGSPGGSVNFIIDGNTLNPINRPVSAGQATLQISTLSVSAPGHTVQVNYLGDDNFNISSGNLSPNHSVVKADTVVTVSSSVNPSVVQQNVTFTANIGVQSPGAGAPGGTVDFVIDGQTVGDDVPVNGGVATFNTSSLTVGSHTVQVSYNGDPSFNTNSGALAPNQQVNQNPIAFVIVPGAVKSGASFTVVVHLRNAAGTGPDSSFNGAVNLAVNSGPGALGGVTTVNAVNGVATFTGLSLARAGSYNLRAVANNLPPVISSNLEVLASSLIAAVAPARVLINRFFSINALAVDVTGNVAANYNGFFSLSIVRKPIGARVSGQKFGFFSDGFGQLNGLKVSKAGIYTFRLNGPNGLTRIIRINIRGRRTN